MAKWSNATLTNVGHELQAKLISTDTLKITRAVAGTSRVAADKIKEQTEISNIAQTLDVELLTYDRHGNAVIKVGCDNRDVSTSYTAYQIGIYATDPDIGEILYAIAQEETNGDYIPSITEQPNGYYGTWTFLLSFGSASSVDVTIDPTHAITREEADGQYSSKEETAAAVEMLDNAKVDKITGKGLSTNDFTNTLKEKLDGIEKGAQVNTVTSVAGKTGDVTLEKKDVGLANADNTADKDKPVSTAQQKALDDKVDKVTGKGLSDANFTAEEKEKLKNIAPEATKTIVDDALSDESTNPVQNKVVKKALDNKVGTVPGMGLSQNSYTNEEKEKLNNIAPEANKTVVDSSLNKDSVNPVQNKAVYAALENKVSKDGDKVLSSNDYTTEEKNKLAGIEEGANKYVHVPEVFIVNGTKKDGVCTIDKTCAEVVEAYKAGKIVFMKMFDNGDLLVPFVGYATLGSSYIDVYYCSLFNAKNQVYYVRQSSYAGITAGYRGEAIMQKGAGGKSVILNSEDNDASGTYSLASGVESTSMGYCSRTGGYKATAAGDGATAEGYSSYHSSSELPDLTNDTDAATVIEAYDYSFMLAFGKGAHAEGIDTLAVGEGAHAEGDSTMAVADGTHSEGYKTEARGENSHAEGEFTEALGEDSHAEGYFTKANGDYSHAANYYTIANWYQTAVGRLNKDTTCPTGEGDTTGSLFIVGNGTNQGNRSNAFRVAADGKVYGSGSYNSSGADVAEMWEWEDGNPNGEDRRGLLVTLNGDKIRPANADDDFILGFVSAVPCLVGNAADDWHGKYLKDVFGQPLTEQVDVPETTEERERTYIDKETGEKKTEIVKKVIPAHTETRYILNPDFDPEKTYIPREERKEWSYVGFHGQIVTVDDGTCQVNGYCAPSKDGIVTASATATDIRVMQRIDDTHIKVYVR